VCVIYMPKILKGIKREKQKEKKSYLRAEIEV
jgi:hypothetical protein